jgi:DNA-binding XRE family transcriptional regulator
MLAEMTSRPIDKHNAMISLKIPASDVDAVMDTIRGVLALSGHKVAQLDEDTGERLYSIEEVFPEATPGMMLRGLRGKEELTQAKFAGRLGISQHHVSEMENNKRGIGIDMAKRIADAFNVPYKMFL